MNWKVHRQRVERIVTVCAVLVLLVLAWAVIGVGNRLSAPDAAPAETQRSQPSPG